VTDLSVGVLAIAAAYDHSCAITQSGGVRCWGTNTYGELGDGTTRAATTPVNVVGLGTGVRQIVVGGHDSCALTKQGGVKCWGVNEYGVLGNGTLSDSAIPSDVVGLTSGVSAIAAGLQHTCALTTGAGVKCWGRGAEGQLGNGATVDFDRPTDVTGLTSGVSAITAGWGDTCAVTSGGVKCWGASGDGQLPTGCCVRATPVAMPGLSDGVLAIAIGWTEICAVTARKRVVCRAGGANRQVPSLTTDVTAIAAGYLYACAVKAGGVRCWGTNESGQLGDGTTTESFLPVEVNFSGLTAPATDAAPIGAPRAAEQPLFSLLAGLGAGVGILLTRRPRQRSRKCR
jgi:alpha-tubulin suppressor-like RCC1 family protein